MYIGFSLSSFNFHTIDSHHKLNWQNRKWNQQMTKISIKMPEYSTTTKTGISNHINTYQGLVRSLPACRGHYRLNQVQG